MVIIQSLLNVKTILRVSNLCSFALNKGEQALGRNNITLFSEQHFPGYRPQHLGGFTVIPPWSCLKSTGFILHCGGSHPLNSNFYPTHSCFTIAYYNSLINRYQKKKKKNSSAHFPVIGSSEKHAILKNWWSPEKFMSLFFFFFFFFFLSRGVGRRHSLFPIGNN